jgi:hypothetical protein
VAAVADGNAFWRAQHLLACRDGEATWLEVGQDTEGPAWLPGSDVPFLRFAAFVSGTTLVLVDAHLGKDFVCARGTRGCSCEITERIPLVQLVLLVAGVCVGVLSIATRGARSRNGMVGALVLIAHYRLQSMASVALAIASGVVGIMGVTFSVWEKRDAAGPGAGPVTSLTGGLLLVECALAVASAIAENAIHGASAPVLYLCVVPVLLCAFHASTFTGNLVLWSTLSCVLAYELGNRAFVLALVSCFLSALHRDVSSGGVAPDVVLGLATLAITVPLAVQEPCTDLTQ